MDATTTLRTLGDVARRGLGGVALVAVLLLGVVAMHAMSGSASHHGTGAPASVEHVHGHEGAVATLTGHETAPASAAACDADCRHELMTAMCLMVLITLVPLAGPSGAATAVVRGAFSRMLAVAVPRDRAGTAPDLHALGILRT
jgi:hypothetical protein